ncbi:hypothetical protein AERO8C_140295 [Aeromonas veronii]|uniref:Uncharacterized protein n=1 Tax=Aeromonas veronii TaxID=654 RepID=A0A653KU95_AERVE|nr:hypothetical protein AERO8C_140295 [Aeromonas veronii]
MGEAVEYPTNNGADAIHPQPAHDITAPGRMADDVAKGQKHPHGFDKGDQHDHRQGGDGDGIEGGPAEGEGHYGGKPGCLAEAIEAHFAHGDGHHETEDDPEQHRDIAEKALGEAGHQQDKDEHQKAGADIAQAAIFRITLAPRHPVDPHLHDADPDGGDNHPGDDGGEEWHQPTYQRHQQGRNDTGSDGGAEDARQPQIRVGSDGQHGHHGGKGDRHDDRQPDPGKAANPDTLQQGDDAAAEEVRTDKVGDLLLGQPQTAANHQWHRHGAGVHHQHMLQAQGKELAHGEHALHFIHRALARTRSGGGGIGLVHEQITP